MTVSLSRRSFFKRFVEAGKSWDLVLLIVLPVIFALIVVFTIKAVLLTPVAVENKERLEEEFRENRRQAIQEYEDGKQKSGVAVGVQDAAAPKPARDP